MQFYADGRGERGDAFISVNKFFLERNSSICCTTIIEAAQFDEKRRKNESETWVGLTLVARITVAVHCKILNLT